jgi:TatD DNase family protein
MEVFLMDSHAHMADEAFKEDLAEVLSRAKGAGVFSILSVSEKLLDAERTLELSEQYPMLLPAAGLAPSHLNLREAEVLLDFIRRERGRLRAIGEVGLDYWVAKAEGERALQGEIFKGFIDLAVEVDLPLNVHSRAAGGRVIELLLRLGASRVQLHAFDGRAKNALPGVEAGFFFSIPPSIVRSPQKQKLVKSLPLEVLLVESDSPVLGPTGGERNEPANVLIAIDAIARIKNLSKDEVLEAVSRNAKRLYFGE